MFIVNIASIHRSYKTALIILVFAVAIGANLRLSFEIPVNLDNSQPAIVFHEIVKNHNITLKHWYLLNDPFLFTDLPVYLFMGIVFGMTPLTLKVGAFLIYCAGVVTIVLIIKKSFSGFEAVLAAFMLVAPNFFSAEKMLQPYHHIGTIFFCFLSVWVFIRYFESSRLGERLVRLVLLAIISSAATFSDPYFIVLFVVPASMSIIVVRLQSAKHARVQDIILFIIIIAGSSVVGLGLQQLVQYNQFHIVKAVPLSLDAFSRLGENIRMSFWFLATVLESDFLMGDVPSVVDISLHLANLLLIASAWVFAPIILMKSKTFRARVFLAFVLFLSVSLVGAVTLMTKLNVDENLARLFVPLYYVHSVFVALIIAAIYRARKRVLFSVAMAVLVFVLSMNVVRTYSYQSEQPYKGLPEYLSSKGLEYGFAALEQANVISFLSSHRVHASPLAYENGIFHPRFWVSSSSWFHPSSYEGETFLAVSPVNPGFLELLIKPDIIESVFGAPERRLLYKKTVIYTWPYNIMRRLFVAEASDALFHTTGKYVTKENITYLQAEKKDNGVLMATKPWVLSEGSYRAVFEVSTSDHIKNEVVGTLGIRTIDQLDQSAVTHTKPLLSDPGTSWRRYDFEFRSSGHQNSRFGAVLLLNVNGQGTVRIRSITLERL